MSTLEKRSITVGDGFKFGIGFTLGSLVASLILIPIFACIGFAVMTVLGGSLAALMESMPVR